MSRRAPSNLPAIGRFVARERKDNRAWKVIADRVEAKFKVRYGRTRLVQLFHLYRPTRSRR